MCKWWGPKLAYEIVHTCLLTHGHGAYSDEMPYEQRLRDVLGLQIGDGTAQIMKLVIAREKAGRDAVSSLTIDLEHTRRRRRMSKVLYEKRDEIAVHHPEPPGGAQRDRPRDRRPPARGVDRLPRRPSRPAGDPHGCRRQDVLRRRGPQKPRRPVARRRPEPRAQPARDRLRGRHHAWAAPHEEAGHRGAQRLGHRRRDRAVAGMRHPDRRRARQLRVLSHAPRDALRRRRDRAAREHLRRRNRDGTRAHGRARRRAAGQGDPPRQPCRPARRADEHRRGHRAQRSCATRASPSNPPRKRSSR